MGILHYDLDIGKFFPTLGALILFCERPELYMPHLSIKIVNKLKEDIQIDFISGNILSQARAIHRYIESLQEEWKEYPLRR